MRLFAFLSALFACAGHGSRLHVEHTESPSSSLGGLQKVGNAPSSSESRAEARWSQRDEQTAEPSAAKALVHTLLSLTSPAAGWQVLGHRPLFPASGVTHSASAGGTSRFGDEFLRHPRAANMMAAAARRSAVSAAQMTVSRPLEKATTLEPDQDSGSHQSRKLRVMIAGGGIGGLCAALVLKNAGFDVKVFEKTTQYRPFGGPIQIATNALECLRRIDSDVYAKIIESSTVIGDRINGLKDGVSNEWFATFDLMAPAQRRQQDPSVVIDRPVLQEILLSRVREGVTTGAEVVGYEQKPNNGGIVGFLSDGSEYEADLLIGSDGIRSKVREKFYPNPTDPIWSGYTCFAAIANCVPDDIKDVGYKVFLGSRKYFVSVDVGGGRIQWYAFLNIPPRSLELSPAESIKWLKETQFQGWSEEVHQLLDCTPEDQVEQRDLYDRAPELNWAVGNVCLLGDAVHPMMPNLGQGGGMAIEDALVLGQELIRMGDWRTSMNAIPRALEQYNSKRAIRASAVQGMSRLSSAILFQYNHPTEVESWSPFKIKNFGPRSVITRACQGFLQRVAFPLQFEFLFSFPGNSLDPEVFEIVPGEAEAQVIEELFQDGVAEWWKKYFRTRKPEL